MGDNAVRLSRMFLVKVLNNERKFLTRYKIIDSIAEQTATVIAQVCKKSKLLIHANLRQLSSSFIYSFKFTYFCIAEFC